MYNIKMKLKNMLSKIFGKNKTVTELKGDKSIKVLIYNTGQSFVTDSSGQDIEGAGKNWFLVYIEYLAGAGIDLSKCEFVFENNQKVKISKTAVKENGEIKTKYNYSIHENF